MSGGPFHGASLAARLALSTVALIAAALAVSGVAIVALFERHAERAMRAELKADLDLLIAGLSARDGKVALRLQPLPDPRFLQPYSGFYWQVVNDRTGAVIRSPSLWTSTIALPRDELPTGALHVHRLQGPADATLLVLERRLPPGGGPGTESYRFAVAVDATRIAAMTAPFARELLAALAALAAALTLAAVWQAQAAAAPLRDLRGQLRAVAAGRSARLPETGPAELAGLKREFNALLEGRRRSAARARERAADMVHALKTPLAVLQTIARRLAAAGAAEEAADIAALSGEMARRVERELQRARLAGASAGAAAALAETAGRTVRALSRVAAHAALDWRVEIAEDARLAVDPGDLGEALGALIDNAARHAAGVVRLSCERLDDQWVVHVDDDGPGPDGPGAPGDAGIGLDVARDIADAYDGAFTLASGPLGGARASLRLPAA